MLPAAVPETQIPLAKARCLSKYRLVMMIPGVVLNPAPRPFVIDSGIDVIDNTLLFIFQILKK